MQSFSRGWSFLKEAWTMAFKDNDLIKPTIYSLFVGFFISIVFLLPMAGVGFLVGTGNLTGQVLLVILGALLVFAQYATGYIFSAMTIYLICDALCRLKTTASQDTHGATAHVPS
ncbi:MAG: hypothetical protein ABSB41_15755 [Anaerolineales bacterium]|jgi:hypothetical protein